MRFDVRDLVSRWRGFGFQLRLQLWLELVIELGLWLKAKNMRPRQAQDFIPTPMAIATTMYVTGIDPLTMKPVPVVRDLREKRMMKSLLYWWDDTHHELAREALPRAGRTDLIGHGAGCLVPPERGRHVPGKAAGREERGGRERHADGHAKRTERSRRIR